MPSTDNADRVVRSGATKEPRTDMGREGIRCRWILEFRLDRRMNTVKDAMILILIVKTADFHKCMRRLLSMTVNLAQI